MQLASLSTLGLVSGALNLASSLFGSKPKAPKIQKQPLVSSSTVPNVDIQRRVGLSGFGSLVDQNIFKQQQNYLNQLSGYFPRENLGI